MDNMTENLALGVSMVTDGVVGIVLIAAFFISNFRRFWHPLLG